MRPPRWNIREADALSALREMGVGTAHCIVTSPPYWGLRGYDEASTYGMESTPEEYIQNLLPVFDEMRRVLHPLGTLWLVIGDSYAGSGGGWCKDMSGPNFRHRQFMDDLGYQRPPGYISSRQPSGLKPKDIVGIPWKLALALQFQGWWLRSPIVWAKNTGGRETVKDRPKLAHEYVMLLSKSERYYFDQSGLASVGLGSVWYIPPRPYPGHPATFPPALVTPCVLAGTPSAMCGECGNPIAPEHVSWPQRCSHNDAGQPPLVLDPFAGSGTTGLVAQREGRDFQGIDLHAGYCERARERIRQDAPMLNVTAEVARCV